jgi:putative transposase
VYLSLGLDEAERQANYLELFRHELDPGLVDSIRDATNGNFALGNERFCAELAVAQGRRVTPGVSGRPKNAPVPESLALFPGE